MVTIAGQGFAVWGRTSTTAAELVPEPPIIQVRTMFSNHVRRPAGPVGAILIVLTLVLAAETASAQPKKVMVYLKDGTILNGVVVGQKESFSDDNGMDYTVFKAGGFFAVGDGARVTIFAIRNLDPSRGVDGVDEIDIRKGFQKFERPYPKPRYSLPANGIFPKTPPEFNANGERTLNLLTEQGREPVRQRLTYMTPYMFRLDGVEHKWLSCYLTEEMDPKLVLKLLLDFPRVADKAAKQNVDIRMSIVRFFLQAKRFEIAEQELSRLLNDIPSAKDRVAAVREELRSLRAGQDLQDATTALAAGQIQTAQALLQRVPKEGLEAELNVSVNTLRVKIDTLLKQRESAFRFLRRLPGEANGRFAEILCEASGTIRDELFLEGLDRLEPFLSLAEQADRAKAQSRNPAQTPEELLALAVTGWLLGKEQAENKPEVAAKLWKARRFASEYLASPLAKTRGRLLEQYRKDDPVEMEELARIIALMPAPDPLEANPSFEPVRRSTRVVGTKGGVKYEILTPPEYTPGRPYPMLVALHHKGERPLDILKRYGLQALKNGYILVAPDYSEVEGSYFYTADEHLRVLDVIHEVQQHYNVDSDRVFLAGWGEGGNAAWDIGLSHPDLFAGILPMSSQPKLSYTMPYWPNARNLPFYVTTGDLAGDSFKQIQRVMGEWINKGFPAMHTVYLGRGVEWFNGELPFMFDWMSHKKRATGYPELGISPVSQMEGTEAYKAMRTIDNHFYWISTDGEKIDRRFLYEGKPSNKNVVPARIQASIRPGNDIRLYTVGLHDVTLSFGPGMIDFAKPVTVLCSGLHEKKFNSKVPLELNLGNMMEDLYERGDRRRPVLAHFNINP